MNPYSSFLIESKRFEIIIHNNTQNIIISKQIQDIQYYTIQNLVAKCFCPNIKTLEIGSWSGLSAILIGEIVQRAKGIHYCIDWYKGNPNGEGNLTKEIIEKFDIPKIFRENVEFFNLSDTIKQIIKTSEEASKLFEDNYFDFIFIDGNHYYEYIIQDFELWYPKLKKGRIISGHDYLTCHDAVNYLIEKYSLNINIENDIWWVNKSE